MSTLTVYWTSTLVVVIFSPISSLFSYWFFPVFPYLPSIGFFLSWSTSSEDIPHIPYSQWPTVIPDMDIG